MLCALLIRKVSTADMTCFTLDSNGLRSCSHCPPPLIIIGTLDFFTKKYRLRVVNCIGSGLFGVARRTKKLKVMITELFSIKTNAPVRSHPMMTVTFRNNAIKLQRRLCATPGTVIPKQLAQLRASLTCPSRGARERVFWFHTVG